MKNIFLSFFLISTILSNPYSYCSDLGIQGTVYGIEEENLLEYILAKTEKVTLPDQEKFREKQIETFKKPQRVELGEASENKTYFFDPKVRVQEDIKDNEGLVVVKKGTVFNPLKTVSLNQDLIFFDGTKKEHLQWAEINPKSKWILINGDPIELEKEFNRPIYFDQSGAITKKLKIQNVPAKVSQQGLNLKIEEIFLGGLDEK